MTIQEFKNMVVKSNWYDKYYYYLMSIVAIGGSIYLFYDIGINPLKYRTRNSYEMALMAYCYAIYLIPNRFKVLTIDSTLTIDKKEEIISKLLHRLDISFADKQDGFYSFNYQRKWWTTGYNVYLFVDDEKFFLSVLGKTHAYPARGFIDSGGTERVRKKIISTIKSLTDDK
jgi:hypothetical protein